LVEKCASAHANECWGFDADYKSTSCSISEVFIISHWFMMILWMMRHCEGHETSWKNGISTPVLSGDAMLILYQYFAIWTVIFRDLAKLFSKTALEVCEKATMGCWFWRSYRCYHSWIFKMIQYKTAVLVAAAMKMGDYCKLQLKMQIWFMILD
jgi:geranylgeranyl diphosphate synthase type II